MQTLMRGATNVAVELAQALTTQQAMTKPDVNGTPALPKRNAPKMLLPSTWLQRSVRLTYAAADGSERETRGTLLDLYPAGPILSILGAKTMIAWERVVVCELIED
jgi:hypothetical protein